MALVIQNDGRDLYCPALMFVPQIESRSSLGPMILHSLGWLKATTLQRIKIVHLRDPTAVTQRRADISRGRVCSIGLLLTSLDRRFHSPR